MVGRGEGLEEETERRFDNLFYTRSSGDLITSAFLALRLFLTIGIQICRRCARPPLQLGMDSESVFHA